MLACQPETVGRRPAATRSVSSTTTAPTASAPPPGAPSGASSRDGRSSRLAFANWHAIVAQEGKLAAATAAGRPLRITLATRARPRPHRRPLAFAALARAFGCSDVVGRTELWRMTIAELHASVAHDPQLREVLDARVHIDHDGTIATLVEEEPRGGSSLKPIEAARIHERAAASEEVPASDTRKVSDWVCLLTLDYVAAHRRREALRVSDAGQRLFARNNTAAFRAYVDPATLAPQRQRLRETRHFPATLRRALGPKGANTIVEQLASNPALSGLFGPRQRADMADRLVTVRSLIHTLPADSDLTPVATKDALH